MSEAELDEIISHLDDQYQSIALVMAYTGLDLSDAVNPLNGVMLVSRME